MGAATRLASLGSAAESLAGLLRPRRRAPAGITSPVVLRLRGDAADPERVQRLLREFLAHLRRGTDRIHLDMLAVERADSKLVACLVVLAGRARRSGCHVTVACTDLVWSWISVCRLDDLFERRPGRLGAAVMRTPPARSAA